MVSIKIEKVINFFVYLVVVVVVIEGFEIYYLLVVFIGFDYYD